MLKIKVVDLNKVYILCTIPTLLYDGPSLKRSTVQSVLHEKLGFYWTSLHAKNASKC
jgi:hypothetical protein